MNLEKLCIYGILASCLVVYIKATQAYDANTKTSLNIDNNDIKLNTITQGLDINLHIVLED